MMVLVNILKVTTFTPFVTFLKWFDHPPPQEIIVFIKNLRTYEKYKKNLQAKIIVLSTLDFPLQWSLVFFPI